MKIFKLLRNKIYSAMFITSFLSIIINPSYLIRSYLYKNIKDLAKQFKGRVLDFGCGDKPYEMLFNQAEEYVGVDIKLPSDVRMKNKADYLYDGMTLPFENSTFDSVVSFEVFEHVFNINQMMSEIYRILKNEGTVLISIPFSYPEHEIPYDYARYTQFGISDILKKNNFQVVKIVKTTTHIIVIFQLLINYINSIKLFNNKIFKIIIQLIVIFPINIFALILNFILPKKYGIYCNLIVLAVKN